MHLMVCPRSRLRRNAASSRAYFVPTVPTSSHLTRTAAWASSRHQEFLKNGPRARCSDTRQRSSFDFLIEPIEQNYSKELYVNQPYATAFCTRHTHTSPLQHL